MPKNKKTTKPKPTLTPEEREAFMDLAHMADLAASLLKSGVQLGGKIATLCSKAISDFLEEKK